MKLRRESKVKTSCSYPDRAGTKALRLAEAAVEDLLHYPAQPQMKEASSMKIGKLVESVKDKLIIYKISRVVKQYD